VLDCVYFICAKGSVCELKAREVGTHIPVSHENGFEGIRIGSEKATAKLRKELRSKGELVRAPLISRQQCAYVIAVAVVFLCLLIWLGLRGARLISAHNDYATF
jgi:hypothetical protein